MQTARTLAAPRAMSVTVPLALALPERLQWRAQAAGYSGTSGCEAGPIGFFFFVSQCSDLHEL